MVGWVDPDRLLEDAEGRVAGDVEGEEAGRADASVMPEPDEEGRQRKVPDQLVQESRVEGGERRVSGRSVGRRDLQRPRQVGRATEQLLVEVVADPADCLADQQRRRDGVHERGGRDARAAKAPEADEATERHPAPDPHAAVPNGERPPPVLRHEVGAGQVEIQAASHESCGKGPEGDVVEQRPRVALRLPAPPRDQHRSRQAN
jgi:hypothetical protein